jgi:hypothetical protein
MLLNVFDFGVLADMEAVDAVMTGFLAAAVGDAATGDNRHVAVFSHIKVIVDQILDAGLCNDDRDMDRLIDGVVFDNDIDSGLIFLRHDIDVGSGISACKFSV